MALRAVADALAVFMAKHGGGEHAMLVRLWEHWDMVLGEDIAPIASPLGHRKDTLLIAAEDSMTAQDIAMQAQDILERVNAFLDGPRFSRIQVELDMGRRSLTASPGALRPAPPALPPLPRPEKLGFLTGAYDPASPVGRCYEAYLRYFQRRELS